MILPPGRRRADYFENHYRCTWNEIINKNGFSLENETSRGGLAALSWTPSREGLDTADTILRVIDRPAFLGDIPAIRAVSSRVPMTEVDGGGTDFSRYKQEGNYQHAFSD